MKSVFVLFILLISSLSVYATSFGNVYKKVANGTVTYYAGIVFGDYGDVIDTHQAIKEIDYLKCLYLDTIDINRKDYNIVNRVVTNDSVKYFTKDFSGAVIEVSEFDYAQYVIRPKSPKEHPFKINIPIVIVSAILTSLIISSSKK